MCVKTIIKNRKRTQKLTFLIHRNRHYATGAKKKQKKTKQKKKKTNLMRKSLEEKVFWL